jgi:selenocysteine lyase/cysteine desulfurase
MLNPYTSAVDAEEIAKLVDENICLLSFMSASNNSGAMFDIEGIIKATHSKKSDLFIFCDCVQHVPHEIIDMDKYSIDGIAIGPYKCFGNRGYAFGCVSERAAALKHESLLARSESWWELCSVASGHFASMSAIIDYICWIGSHYIQSQGCQTLIEAGMKAIIEHERALLYRMLKERKIFLVLDI